MKEWEDYLWLLLAIATGIITTTTPTTWQDVLPSWAPWLGILMTLVSPKAPPSGWRAESSVSMELILVPCLFQALDQRSWQIHAKLSVLLTLLSLETTWWTVAIVAALVGVDMTLQTQWTAMEAVAFLVIYGALRLAKNLCRALTAGEFRVVWALAVVGVVEWMYALMEAHQRPNREMPVDYSMIQLSGVVGCLLTTALVAHLPLPLFPRLLLQVVGPLSVVECSLWYGYRDIPEMTVDYFPLALEWLIQFLQETENTYPRWLGLAYWAISLGALAWPTLWLTVWHAKSVSVVLTRKWFHWVAIVLFTPMTWQFPQLLSLSYAIALCILVVLESTRKDVALVEGFFETFCDPTRDDPNGVVLSHMGLIAGCAVPLWLSQLLPGTTSQLLPQWGILCLGVGDAMGAIVGKGLGRHRWGKNRRTLEGSAAMWCSMMAVGMWAFPTEWVALSAATTLVTFLEAHTVHMDNLVLPLAGATVLLLLR